MAVTKNIKEQSNISGSYRMSEITFISYFTREGQNFRKHTVVLHFWKWSKC